MLSCYPFADMQMSEIVMSQEAGSVKYLVLDTKVVVKPPGWEIAKGNYEHMTTEPCKGFIYLISEPLNAVKAYVFSLK